MEFTFDETDTLCVNTIRTLAIDAIEKANSGHPGAPMGLAPVAHVLFNRMMRLSPENPTWADRDRFILSCGHASALLYSVLHLAGFDLTVDDLKDFRQWNSKTPGHPEFEPALGIEMTTGPLGQGCATSVGFALAESHLAARFNRPDHSVVDHHTWVLCGDGDLMEGVSAEAASIAAHLGLGKLVWIWDDNRITIEGATDLAVSDDIPARFAAQGWHVVTVADANDLTAVAKALSEARAATDRPSLVAVRSHIAFGAPNKQDSSSAHGSPLGGAEVRGAKTAYGWPPDETFRVPEEARRRYREAAQRNAEAHSAWQDAFKSWTAAEPESAVEWQRRFDRALPPDWENDLPSFETTPKGPATRAASGTVLNAIADSLPELVGGSADLAPSCKTTLTTSGKITAAAHGERNLHFGIREHGMAAMLNGMSLHGGLRPFGSTFLVFSDYMRPAIRLSALMGQPVIYVFTHDSVWVGEDGPTHQPVEHTAALRLIPGLTVLRPADANETAAAWQVAVKRDNGPTALILSRQALPITDGSVRHAAAGVTAGAYVIEEAARGEAQVVLIASGSEVALATEAAASLGERGVPARVVSMPSWELFDEQPTEVQRQILGGDLPKVAIEAGVGRGWQAYVGSAGAVVSIDRFGASAPGREVAENLGMTVDRVVEAAMAVVNSTK